MDSMATPPDFDAWTQPVFLLNADGSNLTVPVDYFDLVRIYHSRLSIAYGTQIGATLVLLVVLLLLTRAEKRKSSVFLINGLCLTVNFIRCVLLSCYSTSTISNPYSQISGNFTRVTTGDLATAVAANTFTLIVTCLIMISLSIQVWVVCITTAPIHRYVIMGATTLVACVATGFKAAFVIINIKQTLSYETFEAYKYVFQASYITQAIAIWFFSCIFTYKLGYAIVQRRKLKMPQLGPMQIVFIMGCQTMLIPAIFTGLQFRIAIPEFGSIVLTVVCIFLPLSAIWAGVANETAIATGGPDSHHRLIQGEFYRATPNSMVRSNASTMMESGRQLSVCTCATRCKGSESTTTTPSPRRNSVPRYEDDAILIGRNFGFSRGEAGDRV